MIKVGWGNKALAPREVDAALATLDTGPTIIDVVNKIVLEEAARARIGVNVLMGRSRMQHIAHARMRAMARVYEETMMSMPEVGRHFDNRDHTTVLHAVKWYREQVK